jgi:hypothetical protein
MDKQPASHALNVAVDCGAKLNDLVRFLKDHSETEEFRAYRLGIGRVMGELLRQIINPIVDEHEDLRPPQLAQTVPDPKT